MADPRLPIDPDLDPGDPGQPSSGHHRLPPSARRRAQPDVLAAVALGGAIGASARFAVADALPTAAGHFPWATFWTNASGSFLVGFLLVVLLERVRAGRLVRPFLVTGLLGAFTTMSTYQVEIALLLKDGHPATAVLYALGSLSAGVGLAWVGIAVARRTPERVPG